MSRLPKYYITELGLSELESPTSRALRDEVLRILVNLRSCGRRGYSVGSLVKKGYSSQWIDSLEYLGWIERKGGD